jgi:hypothetical protein
MDKQLPTKKSGIYRNPWTCGKQYIGKTRDHISNTISEHEKHQTGESVISGHQTLHRN